ncbi:hypothetical protein HKBW3S25_01995, partial [Candidatus Hakubella thermalkaliphila]
AQGSVSTEKRSAEPALEAELNREPIPLPVPPVEDEGLVLLTRASLVSVRCAAVAGARG